MGRMRPKKEEKLAVACPTCGARVGAACVRLTKSVHHARPYTHPERRRAAAWKVRRQVTT